MEEARIVTGPSDFVTLWVFSSW